MGEEKKKEKKRAKGSNTSLKNTPLKKKKITQHQIFVVAAKFRLELLGFKCSYWVAAHLRMQRNKWEGEWKEESEKPMKWLYYGWCGFRQWYRDTNEKEERGEKHWKWMR